MLRKTVKMLTQLFGYFCTHVTCLSAHILLEDLYSFSRIS